MMPWLEEFLTNMIGDIRDGEPVSVEDLAAHVRRYALEDGVLLTCDQLAQWGGEPVTADLLARLRTAIPNSSIPDAISAIVGGLTDTDEDLGAPSLDDCPECGRRITDFDMSGCEDDTAQRWCVAHLPDDHPQAHLKTS